MTGPYVLFQLPAESDTVHDRHHMIHENKIELYPVNKLYRFHSTFGLGDLQPVGLQEGSCDFSVDQIVVHHQHLIIFWP